MNVQTRKALEQTRAAIELNLREPGYGNHPASCPYNEVPVVVLDELRWAACTCSRRALREALAKVKLELDPPVKLQWVPSGPQQYTARVAGHVASVFKDTVMKRWNVVVDSSPFNASARLADAKRLATDEVIRLAKEF